MNKKSYGKIEKIETGFALVPTFAGKYPIYRAVEPPNYKNTFRQNTEVNKAYIITHNVANALNHLITCVDMLMCAQCPNDAIPQVKKVVIEELATLHKMLLDSL